MIFQVYVYTACFFIWAVKTFGSYVNSYETWVDTRDLVRDGVWASICHTTGDGDDDIHMSVFFPPF